MLKQDVGCKPKDFFMAYTSEAIAWGNLAQMTGKWDELACLVGAPLVLLYHHEKRVCPPER